MEYMTLIEGVIRRVRASSYEDAAQEGAFLWWEESPKVVLPGNSRAVSVMKVDSTNPPEEFTLEVKIEGYRVKLEITHN